MTQATKIDLRAGADALDAPYWQALAEGKHTFQRCAHCANAWLPPRQECPRCLRDAWAWETASGDARLISWVVFHTAASPAYAERLPYAVAVVELAEGPRLISNVVGVDDLEALRIDEPLRLRIEWEGEVAVPRYVPVNG